MRTPVLALLVLNFFIINIIIAEHWWLMSIILATQKVEIRKIFGSKPALGK
jgi:hypothetical protein